MTLDGRLLPDRNASPQFDQRLGNRNRWLLQALKVCIAIAAVLVLACPPSTVASTDSNVADTIPASIRARQVVATLATGPDPTDLSELDCEEYNDGACVAGIAMIGPDDMIFFYDYGNNNIKVIPTTGVASTSFAIIPGIDMKPVDGTVTPDGTIYLLVDTWSLGHPIEAARHIIYVRYRNEERWVALPPLAEDSLGRMNEADVLQRVATHLARDVHLLTPRLWKQLFADNPLRSDLDGIRQGSVR